MPLQPPGQPQRIAPPMERIHLHWPIRRPLKEQSLVVALEVRGETLLRVNAYTVQEIWRVLSLMAQLSLGRVDQQVKLRGFRIELGEIEAALQAYPGVQEAVVILRDENEVRKVLVAYVVAQESLSSEQVQ